MKRLTYLLVLLALLSSNVTAQNLFKDATLTVTKYQIDKVRGKKESHVYPDVTKLEVVLGVDVFDRPYTKFSFVNAAGEQSFMAWFKDETIHEGNIVQRFNTLEGDNGKPVMAYLFGARPNIALAIPDSENGLIHKFEIELSEPLVTQKHLAKKIKEKETWDEFKAAFSKIINAKDIVEFRGEVKTDSWASPEDFKCTLNPIGVNEKASFSYHEKSEDGPKRIVFNISSMLVWMGRYQSDEQIESDIERIEACLDKVMGDTFEKVFYPDDKTIGDMLATNRIGVKERKDITDHIYYVHSSEVGAELTALKKTYLHVDIDGSEYSTQISIGYFQQ